MHTERGVTLIELVVLIAIIAILSGIAFPSLASMIAGNNLNTAQEDIISIMKKARGMALSHNTIATVDINAASRTVRLSVADNSFPAETVTLDRNVSIAANTVLSFGASGTVNASTGSLSIALSSPGYSSLSRRTINISPTGIVKASR